MENNQDLNLYVDRLRAGEYKNSSFVTSPIIMEGINNEASYDHDIKVETDATIAAEFLILNISIETEVKIFCKICNSPITKKISVSEKHVSFSLSDMKSGLFSLAPFICELININTPRYQECKGNCPERDTLSKYLKQNNDLTKEV